MYINNSIFFREKMRVFDLMTGYNKESINQPPYENDDFTIRDKTFKEKLKRYKDNDLGYRDVSMPEVAVTVYYGESLENSLSKVETKMKLKRVIEYQHLARDFVDEEDYSPTQEFILYACPQVNIVQYSLAKLLHIFLFLFEKEHAPLLQPIAYFNLNQHYRWRSVLLPKISTNTAH